MNKDPLAKNLGNILGAEKVLGSLAECAAYARDMSIYAAIPDAVVLAASPDDVQKVLEFAGKERIPVTPRGAGTSVTGAVIPIRGGIVLDLSKMNRIKEINLIDRYVVVEPGVICGRLNRALSPEHFFPPDPGSLEVATIGGMISTNASGRSALKYGTTGDYVMALEVVLPSGEIIRTGHHTPKASAGFDLTRLFTSAEGTLGVITEATLRIRPRPEASALCLAGFPSLEMAAEAAVEIISRGISLCACELMDCLSLQEFSRGVGLDLQGTGGMLIMEMDGPSALVSAKMHDLLGLCRQCGAVNSHLFNHPADMERVWRWRHKLVTALNPGTRDSRLIPMAEDIGVPVSKVPEAVRRSKDLAAKHGVPVVLFGHAGDGNIHTTFVLNPRDRDGWQRARSLAAELSNLAVELGGTVSAEHGIGLAKAPFIARELGGTHGLMRKIKDLLDPHGIMNPGKMGFSDKVGTELNHFAFAVPAESPGQLTSLGSNGADHGSLLCMMCGSCRIACPVFAVTGRESDNARGKVQLAYLLRTGEIQLSEDLARKFYLCTFCGACEDHCPSGIAVTSLVAEVRRRICEAGLLPPPLRAMTTNIQGSGNPFGQPPEGRAVLSPLTGDRRRENARPGTPEVLIFLGCLVGYPERNLIPAVRKVLNRARVPYTSLGEQEICCGLPLAQAGEVEAFRHHAAKVATLINARRPGLVITPCPGCQKALSDLYPAWVADWRFKVLSLTEYLYRLTASGELKLGRTLKKKVIYHAPCLLSRQKGIVDEPPRLLRNIPGISLLEFPPGPGVSSCCGGGGGVPTAAPDIAALMASSRLTQAMATGSEIMVTACPTCKRQLARGMSSLPEGKGKIAVMDIVEIVQMALD